VSYYKLSGYIVVEITNQFEADEAPEDELENEVSRVVFDDGRVHIITSEQLDADDFELIESKPDEPEPDDENVQELYKAFGQGYTVSLEIGSNDDGFSIELEEADAANISEYNMSW